MKIFTYNDYLDYTQNYNHQKKLSKEKREKERNIEYDIIDQYILKSIEEKEYIIEFLYSFYKKEIQDIKTIDLEKISDLKTKNIKENTQIYKHMYKEMYFIIQYENQFYSQKIFEILQICMELIKKWKEEKIKYKNQNKSFRYPIIIPIIIYTGEKEWRSKKHIKLTQTEFENNGVYFSYNLINIKNMSMLKLLEKDTLITDLLLLKKCEGNIKTKMLEILMEDTRNVNKYYIYKKIKDAEIEIKL